MKKVLTALILGVWSKVLEILKFDQILRICKEAAEIKIKVMLKKIQNI